MNGIVYFSPQRAVSFYTKILNLVLDVKTTINEEEKIYLMNAVYGNGFFHKVNNPDKDVYNKNGETKYRHVYDKVSRNSLWF